MARYAYCLSGCGLMLEKVVPWILIVFEVIFFTGLIGCAVTIAVSWVEILADGFSKDDSNSE